MHDTAQQNPRVHGNFLEKLAPVEEKVLSVLMEVPQSITLAAGREWLENILTLCTYHGYSAAIQFYHPSWYQDLTYNILKKHSATLVWSDYYPCAVVTSPDLLYMRLAGSGNESVWLDKLREVSKDSSVDNVIIALGSPSAANGVLKLLGLPERNTRQNSFPSSETAIVALTPPDYDIKPEGTDKVWTSHRVIMCIDLNAFYPSCEELRNAALKGKAHAVIMTDEKAGSITKGVVSSCSYEARRYGVASAMPLARAKSLCPELILVPVDIPYYRQISDRVMAILEEYADVLEQASIDEAFLDCTKKIQQLKDTGIGVREYAARIKTEIREKCGGLSCSIGVASTKSAAKIASDYKKPDGLTVIHPSELAAFLSPLKASTVSGIGPKTQLALKSMRIETIRQLAKADIQVLKDRFGKNGVWMWQVANGTDGEPVVAREEHVSLSTESTLDKFTKSKQEILASLHDLAEEMYLRAQNHHYLFRTVGVKLVRTDFTIESRETTYHDLQNSRQSISSVLEQLLDRFSLSDDKPAVRKVGLRISHIVTEGHSHPASDGSKRSEPTDIQKTMSDYLE